MANLLHELADIIHCFGDEMKSAADRLEGIFARDAVPVAQDAMKSAAETVIKDAAEKV